MSYRSTSLREVLHDDGVWSTVLKGGFPWYKVEGSHGWIIWTIVEQKYMGSCPTSSRQKDYPVQMDLQNKTSIRWIYYQVQGSISWKGVFTSSWVGLQWNIHPCYKNGFHKVGFFHCSFEEMGGTSHGCEEWLPTWWLGRSGLHKTTWGVHW